jgi:ATP-binding cassette subfamily F protein 3
VIHFHSIGKQYGTKVLFENVTAQLGNRSRVGLVGANGSGKSTLIRILLNQETADTGEVTRASHLSIGYLAQELPKLLGKTVLSEVMRLDGRREDLLAARQELELVLAEQSEDSECLERYGRVLEELEVLDEYRLEARAKQILSGIGFQDTDFDRSLTELSGGWLMRVALARILLIDPDLLLLDEPTNHLDLESLLWLEGFLKRFRGALLIVSHDRAFANRLVEDVWEIDQSKLTTYRGNLDAYALQKQERLAILEAQYKSQQAKIAEVEKFVNRFGAKASKAKQAQSRIKNIEKMDLIELPESRASIRFRFPAAPQSGREVVTLQSAQMIFGEKVVFKNLNWTLQRGSRVAIVGVNGAGKTTLLKLLSGSAVPTQGGVKFGHEVRVGYYAQHQTEALHLEHTILQELEQVAPEMPISQVRGIAGAFLFSGSLVEKKCKILSGGEKARVALAKLLLSPSNFLILDEPTNHLDAESREVLLHALQNYSGTLCLVSHDREFVSPLVDSVLEMIPNAGRLDGTQVVQLLGGYEDYLQRKMKEMEAAGPGLSQVTQKSEKLTFGSSQGVVVQEQKGPSNNQKKSWEREMEKIESEISLLERRQSELHGLLGQVETYQDQVKSFQLGQEQKQTEKLLSEKLSQWEELSHRLYPSGSER